MSLPLSRNEGGYFPADFSGLSVAGDPFSLDLGTWGPGWQYALSPATRCHHLVPAALRPRARQASAMPSTRAPGLGTSLMHYLFIPPVEAGAYNLLLL